MCKATRLMTISAFSRRSMLSSKALRMYDSSGLLQPVRVDPQTGYRMYSEQQLETARLISMLRRLDMPLSIIGDILLSPSGEQSDAIGAWWHGEQRRHAARSEVVSYVRGFMLGDAAVASRIAHGFDVRLRDVPRQTLVTEMHWSRAVDLAGTLDAAFARLREHAGEFGGATGHRLVIYHGDVGPDSDGPVEVCLPIAPPAGRPESVRQEPEHREAYVSVRRSLIAWPEILSAYSAVDGHMHRHEMYASGPAREVYIGDMHTAEPDDLVCEIAIPVSITEAKS